MKEYKGKNCLVTGGTGLIGRQVVDLLVEYGAFVDVVSLDKLLLNEYVGYYTQDLSDFKFSCMPLMRNRDYIFHLAGIKASPDITNQKPATMSIPALQINTNVLGACRINNIKNVLFTSSIGAYSKDVILTEENAYKGEPMDFYPGMVKRMAEYQIHSYKKEFGLDYKIVRLGNVYGIGDNFDPNSAMFIPSLMAKILRGDKPVVLRGDGSNIRDFIYSRDIARGILLTMLSDEPLVNLSSGEGISIRQVVEWLQLITPFEVKYIGGDSGIHQRVLGISKARKLGFKPEYTLYKGLKETWNWFKDNPEEYKRRLNYFANTRD